MKENSQGGMGNPAIIRLAIIGGAGVGKSALTVRFLTKRFIGEYEHNVEYTYKRETELSDAMVCYELKDTSAKACTMDPEAYAAWAISLVVVYSIVDRDSFVTAAELLQDITPYQANRRRYYEMRPSVALVANKSDLDYCRCVSIEEGQSLALRYSASFYEVSAAKDFENVLDLFKRVLNDGHQNLLNTAHGMCYNSNGSNNNSNENLLSDCNNVEDEGCSAELTEGEEVRLGTKRTTRKERVRKRAERKHSVKQRLSAVIFKRKTDLPIE